MAGVRSAREVPGPFDASERTVRTPVLSRGSLHYDARTRRAAIDGRDVHLFGFRRRYDERSGSGRARHVLVLVFSRPQHRGNNLDPIVAESLVVVPGPVPPSVVVLVQETLVARRRAALLFRSNGLEPRRKRIRERHMKATRVIAKGESHAHSGTETNLPRPVFTTNHVVGTVRAFVAA